VTTAKKVVIGAITAAVLLALGFFVVVKSQGAPRTSAANVTMMSDLKNLAMYQGYVKDSTGRYATTLEALDYRLSEGVTDLAIALTPDGYTMSVGHRESPVRCAIYAGSTAIAPATRPGTPACTSSAR
jgi:hypothetical protein